MINLEELKKPQANFKMEEPDGTNKERTFYFSKLNVNDAFDLLDYLRNAISNVDINSETNPLENVEQVGMQVILKLLAGFKPECVTHLKDVLLSKCVYFKYQSEKQYIVEHNRDMLLQGLDPLDIYELIARCLVINFFSSYKKITRFIANIGLTQIIDTQKQNPSDGS